MSENVKNAVHDGKFRLNGPRDPNDRNKKPDSLSFSMFNHSPSLACFTEKGNVFFPLDVLKLTQITDTLQELSRYDAPKQFRWEVKGFDKNSRKNEVRGTLIAGRAESGEVFLAVIGVGWDKPVKFPFRPAFDFRPMDVNGNYLDEKEISGVIARNYAKALYDTFIQCYVDDYKHPEPRGQGGNRGNYNGNSSYQRNNNSGGGYNNNSSSNNTGGAPASDADWDVDII